MKKLFLSLIVAAAGSTFIYAQNTFPTTGSAGIATSSPTHSLTLGSTANGIAAYNTVDQTVNFQRLVQGWNAGNYQIGMYYAGSASLPSLQIGLQTVAGYSTLAGSARLFSINGNASSTAGVFDLYAVTGGSASMITLQGVGVASTNIQNWVSVQPTINQSGSAGYRALLISPYLQSVGTGTTNYLMDVGTNTAQFGSGTHNSKFVVTSAGGVGVGTTYIPSGYLLAINGSAIAQAITVQVRGSWPDYVFKPSYHLPTLNEIKTYIDQNQHLPDMPSAAEVAKNGLNLGEMNELLTKKVEELTLYLIEKDKEDKEQKKIIQAQQKQIDLLIKQVNLLAGQKK
jgi:hypothetical protein